MPAEAVLEGLAVNLSANSWQRIDERIANLTARFSDCLCQFEKDKAFSGPSLHFHRRTIARLHSHDSVESVLEDEQYFEYLYATLTSWGLHRMGKSNTKLRDFDVFGASARSLFSRVGGLFGRSILDLADHEIATVAAALGDAAGHRTSLSEAKATLVVNSKALHHFLPDLVPPIDRAYTLAFFFERMNLPDNSAREVLETIFPHFVSVGRSSEALIRQRVARNASDLGTTDWNSGHAKVLDNALVGWMRLYGKPRRSDQDAPQS